MKIPVFLLHFLQAENYKNGPNICTKLCVQHVMTGKHFNVNLGYCNFKFSFLSEKQKQLSGDIKLNLILRQLLWLGDSPNLRTL